MDAFLTSLQAFAQSAVNSAFFWVGLAICALVGIAYILRGTDVLDRAVPKLWQRFKPTGAALGAWIIALELADQVTAEGATQATFGHILAGLVFPWGLLVPLLVFFIDIMRVQRTVEPQAAGEQSGAVGASARPSDALSALDQYNAALGRKFAEVCPQDNLAEDLAKTRSRLKQAENDKVLGRFTDAHWKAQAKFQMAPVDKDSAPALTEIRKHYQAISPASDPVGGWIIGPAGSGKTTLLHRVLFELIAARQSHKEQPAPLLIEPRMLSALNDISELSKVDNALVLLEKVLSLWAEYRRQEGVSGLSGPLLMDLIETGKIIVLVDGYDEFQRLPIQAHLAMGIRQLVRLDHRVHYLIASRPEIPEASPWSEEREFNLSEHWTLIEAISYVQQSLDAEHAEEARSIEAYLVREAYQTWLRNPRALDILIRFVKSYREEAAAFFDRDGRSEYGLLVKLTDLAINRLIGLGTVTVHDRDVWIGFLEDMARACLREGVLDLGEVAGKFHDIEKADDLVLAPQRSAAVGGPKVLKFATPNLHDFFQVRPIVQTLLNSETIDEVYDEHWSQSLIQFVAIALNDAKDPHTRRHLAACLRTARSARDLSDADNRFFELAERPGGWTAVNLLQTILKYERVVSGEAAIDAARGWQDMSGLFLGAVQVSRSKFKDIDFSDSLFVRAVLRHSTFERCKFSKANFASADATGAQFIDCDFGEAPDLQTQSSPFFADMLIEGTEFRNCGWVDSVRLGQLGARTARSRYRGWFKKLFSDRQALLLGGTGPEATRYYADRVNAMLADWVRPDSPVIVDLMAGGGNPELLAVLDAYDKTGLTVLGIDRDTSQLLETKERFESKALETRRERHFVAERCQIEGSLDIGAILRASQTRHAPRHADLVIAKKALHEIPRQAQKALIVSCADALDSHGRLVLFADAPPDMGPENRTRLETWRQLLLSEAEQPGGIRYRDVEADLASAIRDALIDQVSFEPTQADYGLFANTWVMLKDWVNCNWHELTHRYFSSAEEVTRWCAGVGLEPVSGVRQDFGYRLAAERFNETGFNATSDYIETVRPKRPSPDELRRRLAASPRLMLLIEFSRTHLWPGLDASEPTAFGALAGADLRHMALSELNDYFPDDVETNVGFHFPVSVLEFRRTGRDAPPSP